jgi:hypothetical protein
LPEWKVVHFSSWFEPLTWLTDWKVVYFFVMIWTFDAVARLAGCSFCLKSWFEPLTRLPTLSARFLIFSLLIWTSDALQIVNFSSIFERPTRLPVLAGY